MNRKRKRLLNAEPGRNSEAQGAPVHEVFTLLDRFGHQHSERVLTMWPPAVLKAMGIHPIKSKEGGERA